jgi:hypothetical protein
MKKEKYNWDWLDTFPNLGYYLFSMFGNFTTSNNSLKRNTSLYSVWGTLPDFGPASFCPKC